MKPGDRQRLKQDDLVIAIADGESNGYRYRKGAIGILCQPPDDVLYICFAHIRLEFSYFSLTKWELLEPAIERPQRRRLG